MYHKVNTCAGLDPKSLNKLESVEHPRKLLANLIQIIA